MSDLPQGYFRNEAARAMAERVRRNSAAESLRVKLNVHLDNTGRDPEVLLNVLNAMMHRKNFILYSDKNNYTIFIPESRAAVCYMYGKEYSTDISTSDAEYETRLKLAIMGYDYFFLQPEQLDNGQTTPVLQLQ